jgi:hypothetical protein
MNKIARGEPYKTASLLGVMRGESLRVVVSTTGQAAIATVTRVEYHKGSDGFGVVGAYTFGLDSEAHV